MSRDIDEIVVNDPMKDGLVKKAIIFCAGLGTRFKPWTDSHPKALALVNGKSLLQRNIEYLQLYNIHDVVLNLHHFGDQIREAVAKNNGWGSHISFSDESEEVLETGGGLIHARPLLGNDTVLALNVDILTDVNLKYFLSFHQQQQALISLAVSQRNTSRYFLFNKYERLCGWRNISTQQEVIAIQAKDYFQKAYSGLALFEPQVFELTTMKGKFSLVDLYLSLAHENKIAGFDHTGEKMIDVGKPESVAQAEAMFA